MPPARRRPTPKTQSRAKPRSKPRARRSSPQLPKLEQRHFDVIGLGLVATAIFFAFVVYLGWDGGQAGEGAVEGLQVLLGAGHYVVPAALMAAGAILVLRPVLPAVRPFKAGAVCLFAAVSLGLAAGTLGIGPGGGPVSWEPEWVKPRGGVVGEGLYWGVSTALGDLGAHTIALFLFTAAVLLLTGASIAGVVKATSDSISTTTREVRTAVQRRRPATEELSALDLGPPPRASAIARTYPEHDETLPDVLGDAEDIEPTVEWSAPEALPAPDEEPHLAEDPETDEPGVAARTRPPSSSRRRAARNGRYPALRRELLRGGLVPRNARAQCVSGSSARCRSPRLELGAPKGAIPSQSVRCPRRRRARRQRLVVLGIRPRDSGRAAAARRRQLLGGRRRWTAVRPRGRGDQVAGGLDDAGDRGAGEQQHRGGEEEEGDRVRAEVAERGRDAPSPSPTTPAARLTHSGPHETDAAGTDPERAGGEAEADRGEQADGAGFERAHGGSTGRSTRIRAPPPRAPREATSWPAPRAGPAQAPPTAPLAGPSPRPIRGGAERRRRRSHRRRGRAR